MLVRRRSGGSPDLRVRAAAPDLAGGGRRRLSGVRGLAVWPREGQGTVFILFG